LRTRRHVAFALAYRQAMVLLKNPTLFLPPLLFPLMNFMAFAGGLSRLRHLSGFDFPGGYTAFQFVFVLLQSAAFSGGFARRLLIAASHRTGIVIGYALAALLRWSLVAVILTIVALLAHMHVGANAGEVVGLYTLAAILNVVGLLWAAGIALRLRSTQGSPLMQTPVFLTLFLAPVFVPLDLLKGWIHAVATVNPLTYVLSAGRGFVAGTPVDVWIAFVCALGLTAAFTLWALRGLRRAERAAA
jgi:ABC-2 type transport system permease protein